jgi:hypothetical protein
VLEHGRSCRFAFEQPLHSSVAAKISGETPGTQEIGHVVSERIRQPPGFAPRPDPRRAG